MELSMPVVLFLVFVATLAGWYLLGLGLTDYPTDAIPFGVLHAVILMIGVWTHLNGYANQTLLMGVFAGALFGYGYATMKYY